MTRHRLILGIIAIVIVITGISAALWWQTRTPAAPVQTAAQSRQVQSESRSVQPAIQTALAEQRDLKVAVRAHGTLQASRDIMIAPKISAPVQAVHASVGDDVAEGDILLDLDRSELELRRDQAVSALRSAESNLARLEAGARPEELTQAEAQVEQAQANLKQATDELERLRTLHSSGAITLSQLEQAQTHVKVAEAQLTALTSQLSLVRQGARPEDIQAARAQVDQAQSGVSLAELQVGYAQVTAPIAGRVVARNVDVGEFAQAGVPAFRLLQLDPIVVRSELGARDIVRINRGDEAILHVDALPGEVFYGAVSLVESAADGATRLYGVEISVPNPGLRLLPGMSGDVEIVLAASKGAVAVPQSAIRNLGASPFVYVVDGSVVRERPISTGIVDGGWVEVLSGVDVGESVVVGGFDGIQDGYVIDGGSAR